MVYTKNEPDGLTLFYNSNGPFILGAVVSVLAAFFGFMAIVSLQEPVGGMAIIAATVTGLATCALGGYAISCFLSGWRRYEHPAWVMRFTPTEVHINSHHPGYSRFVPLLEEHSLKIPLNDVEWIRKTIRPGVYSDDRDQVFVEMRVSDAVFRSVSMHRSAHRKAVEGLTLKDNEIVLRQFEGNVIRVLIEGHQWPEEICDYWRAHPYKIAASFKIEEPVNLDAAKAQPRELF